MPWFTVRQKVEMVEVLRVEADTADEAQSLVEKFSDDHEKVHHQHYDESYPVEVESVAEDK